MRARLFAAGGVPDHSRAGETLAPSHEYLAGMLPPAGNEGLVMMSEAEAAVVFGGSD